MKAAVLKGKNLTIQDVPEVSLKPGEAKIKVEYCGICGTDIHAYAAGNPFLTLQRKNIMGHEFVGMVDELGDGVENVRIGDRVTAVAPGAYAEYAKCSADDLHKLPESIPSDLAALIEPVAVALRGIRRSGISPGSSAAVIGAGPIGLFTLMILKARGMGKVIISEPGENRRRLADEIGATEAVLPKDLIKASKDMTGGEGVDVTFECVGVAESLNSSFLCTKRGGKVMAIGVFHQPYQLDMLGFVIREVALIPSFSCHDELELAIDLLAEGDMPAMKAVSGIISLNEMPEVFARMAKDPDSEVKVLVRPWK